MKKILFILTILALSCFCAVSCLDREFNEDSAVFTVSSSSLLLPCDVEEGKDLVKDTLWVTSNRSWTVSVPDTVAWLHLDKDGHQGLSGVSERVPLSVSCNDNLTEGERSTELHLFCQGESRTIKVLQSSIHRRLVLTRGARTYSDVDPEGQTDTLIINTNCPWTIGLKAGSKVSVRFALLPEAGASPSWNTTLTGTGTAEVLMQIVENDDRENGKNGTVLISAAGCRTIEIPVSQLIGIPIFRVELANKEIKADDGISNYTFPIHTNVKWRADILSVHGYDSLKVTGTYGSKGASSATVIFPYCTAFGDKGKIEVKFTAEDVEGEFVYTIEQNPCIRFGVGKLGSEAMYTANAAIGVEAANWPFKSPIWSYIPSSSASAKDPNKRVTFELLNGYKLYAYSMKGFWKNSKTGWLFGGEAGNYLELPAIPGFSLKKILYCFRGTSAFKGQVQRSKDNAVLAGTFSTGGQGSVTEILVNNAAKGDTCKIVANGATNFQIGEMSLYYE